MRPQTKLKPYMGYSKHGKEGGACLIFAHNVKEAKKHAFGVLSSWEMIEEWIEVRVNLLRNKDFLYDEADKKCLEDNIPHVIESPKVCNSCELWGNELDDESGLCEDCWKKNQDRITG